MEYVGDKPKRIDAVVISTQHDDDVSTEAASRRSEEAHHRSGDSVGDLVDSGTKYHINPTGRFVIGGPHGDTGLTGRKIIVDTYGGMGRHGGGAFSGKDPTKVDRSACYMARYVAKNIVAVRPGIALRSAAGLRDRRGRTGFRDGGHFRNRQGGPDERLVELVRSNFQLTPKGMIDTLKLRRPIYRKTAVFGHFGRTEDNVHLGSHRQGRSSQGRRQAAAVASEVAHCLHRGLVCFNGSRGPQKPPFFHS